MSSPQHLQEVLRRHGHSNTLVRRLVFDVLHKHERLTPAEICTALSGQIDRASVYRTIALYEKLGVLQRLYNGWKYVMELSDTFSDHHHHVTCRVCHKVVTLQADLQLEATIQAVARQAGFTTTTHQIEISGLCSECDLENDLNSTPVSTRDHATHKKTPAKSQGQRKPHTS